MKIVTKDAKHYAPTPSISDKKSFIQRNLSLGPHAGRRRSAPVWAGPCSVGLFFNFVFHYSFLFSVFVFSALSNLGFHELVNVHDFLKRFVTKIC